MPGSFSVPVISSVVSRSSLTSPLSLTILSNCPHRFHETLHRFLVPYLLRNQKTTAERVPVALLPGALFGGLGKEQVAGVVQVGTFVEVAFKTAGEKAEFVPADVRLVFLRDENILFVQD